MTYAFTLPDGWEAEAVSGGGFVLIKSPDKLMVTVDFDKRGFRSGLVTSGRMTSNGTYGGRGWKQALVSAAVKWLDGIRKS